jgi:predicted enzyme related to lactoylglutathione lyase
VHKSRLYLIAIDVHDLDRSFRFWCKALNGTLDTSDKNDEMVCRRIKLPGSNTGLFLKKVREKTHSLSHVHLDIASDNIEAEKNRLEKIGAKPIRFIDDFENSYYVMEDPDKNIFCIVTPEHKSVFDTANIWD